MLIAVAAFGVFMCAACIVGMISPSLLTSLVPWFLKQRMAMVLAVGVRLAIGVLLIMAAPDSLYPLAFRILGGAMIFAAAVLPILGIARLARLVNWVAGWPPLALRAWLVFGFAFGAFLVYGTGLV